MNQELMAQIQPMLPPNLTIVSKMDQLEDEIQQMEDLVNELELWLNK
jgi:hypothetical protein